MKTKTLKPAVMRNIVLRTALGLLVLVNWCAPIAEADRASVRLSRHNYAAIAYSPATGKYGYAYKYRSRSEAQNEALRRCGAEDALIACWVNVGVCALALGDDKTYWGAGWAYGHVSSLDATQRALAECRKTGATGCHTVLFLDSDGQYIYEPARKLLPSDAKEDSSPDYKTAAAAYSKAAELGHPGAQNSLGWLYQNGWGVPRDIERAVYWYRRAVNQGNREAQVNLGWLYEEGWGVPRDYVEAMKLYRLAAAAGEPVAQNNIGNMYLKGLGVRRDLWEAVEWFNKGAGAGEARARQNLRYLKALNRSMDPWLHVLDGRPVMVTVTANMLLYLHGDIPVRLSSGKAIEVQIPIKFFTDAELRDFGILQPNGNIEISGPPRLPHKPMRAPNDTQRQQLLANSRDAIEIFWPPHVVIAPGVNSMGADAKADVREAVELMYER